MANADERVPDFYRPNDHIRAFKANDVGREKAIRLYCTQSGTSWSLQLRTPMSLGSSGLGREGKDFVIAGASLGMDDMRALRDAIDAFLEEAGEATEPAALRRLLADLEYVGGDDRSLPACHSCGACGRDRNPAHPTEAELHESDCKYAKAMGRPVKP